MTAMVSRCVVNRKHLSDASVAISSIARRISSIDVKRWLSLVEHIKDGRDPSAIV